MRITPIRQSSIGTRSMMRITSKKTAMNPVMKRQVLMSALPVMIPNVRSMTMHRTGAGRYGILRTSVYNAPSIAGMRAITWVVSVAKGMTIRNAGHVVLLRVLITYEKDKGHKKTKEE